MPAMTMLQAVSPQPYAMRVHQESGPSLLVVGAVE